MNARPTITPEDVADRVADLLPSVTDPAELADAADSLAAMLNAELRGGTQAEWLDAALARLGNASERSDLVDISEEDMPWHDVPPVKSEPRRGVVDVRRFDPVKGGGAEGFNGPAPDPFAARAHETHTRRSNSGRNVTTVTRYGTAPVQGAMLAASVTFDDGDTIDGSAVTSALWSCRRTARGWSSWDVSQVARDFYAADVDAPIGSDVRAFEQVVPGDRSSHALVALSHAGLSGMARDARADRFAAPVATGGVSERLPWPATTLPITRDGHAPSVPLRYGERDRVRFLVRQQGTGPSATLARSPRYVTLCPAIGTDQGETHLWIGHTLEERPAPLRTDGKRTKRADRTIATKVPAPSSVQGWETLLTMLNRGERFTADHPDGPITVTLSGGGKYNVTDERPDRIRNHQGRTAETLALKLAD